MKTVALGISAVALGCAIGLILGDGDGVRADSPQTAAATSPATAPAKDDLRVIVQVSPAAKEYHVGDTIEISVSLKNVSSRKMTVYKPEGALFDPQNQRTLTLAFLTQAVKGSAEDVGGLDGDNVFGGRMAMGMDTTSADVFVPLQPNEATAPMRFKIVLAVTGKMTVEGCYGNSNRVTGRTVPVATAPGDGGETTFETIADLYQGIILGTYEITISDEPPRSMKERFDAARREIDDAALPERRRIDTLAPIAAEKNVLAVRFVLDIWRTTKHPAIKMAALQQWLSLLADGYAYEGFPDAIKMLADNKTPTEIRARILDILGGFFIFADPKAPGIQFRVDDQAQYVAGPTLRKATKDAVTAAYDSGEPSLVEKAKPMLARMNGTK